MVIAAEAIGSRIIIESICAVVSTAFVPLVVVVDGGTGVATPAVDFPRVSHDPPILVKGAEDCAEKL